MSLFNELTEWAGKPFTLEEPENYPYAGPEPFGAKLGQLQEDFVQGNTSALRDEQRYSDGGINLAEVNLRHAGRAGEAVGNTIGTAMSLAAPEWVSEPAAKGMTWAAEEALDTDMVKMGMEYLKANPRIARNIQAGVGILELGLPKALLEPVKRALSAAANYIPNHYTPEIKNLKDMPDDYRSLSQKLLAFNVKGVTTYKEAFHLAQKLTGAGKWAKNGIIGGVNSILNPKARALYDKHGINTTSQAIVKQEMQLAAKAKAVGNHAEAARHKEKAVAQINYNKYITAQTEHKGKIAEVMDNVLKSVSYGGMQPLTKQNYISSAKKQKSTRSSQSARGKKTVTNLEASDADLGYAYDAAQRLWGMQAKEGNKLVVKRNTGIGGKHGSDAITNKNKAHRRIKELYEEIGTDDPLVIYNHMVANPTEGITILNKSLDDVIENGLWLSSSHVGSAVVEGGVNVMTKLMPNKRAMSFVSDVHDFLEKTPVLGKVLGAALPNGEMSITPPIYVDLRPPKVKNRQKRNKGKREDIITLDKGQTGEVPDEMINEYVNTNVSGMDIAQQAYKMPTQAALIGNGLFDYDSERFTEESRPPRQLLPPRSRAR
jgi:hypothetical protein